MCTPATEISLPVQIIPTSTAVLSVHDQVQTIFRPRRHTLSAAAYRQTRAVAHWIRDDITRELKAA